MKATLLTPLRPTPTVSRLSEIVMTGIDLIAAALDSLPEEDSQTS